MTTPVLASVVDRLDGSGAADGATIDRITTGRAAVLVELTVAGNPSDPDANGTRRVAGLAHRPPGPLPPIEGATLEKLLEWATPGGGDPDRTAGGESQAYGRRALGIAAVNALSQPVVEWREGDPMALLDSGVETVTTVGLFRPAFRKFADVEVRVIERTDVGEIPTPDGVVVETFGPADADAAMTGAEVVFVTGSSAIYGGLERYLDAAPASATTVVVGATASFLPEPLFEAGADVVAGGAVVDADRVREAVRDGACGTDLHDVGLRKVYSTTGRHRGLEMDDDVDIGSSDAGDGGADVDVVDADDDAGVDVVDRTAGRGSDHTTEP